MPFRIDVTGVKDLVAGQKQQVAGQDEILAALGRIEALLAQNLQQGVTVADTLDDVRGNLQDLNVDVDAAVTGIQSLRADLADALASAGVDESARAEIMATIDAAQQKLVDALNPQVPVDPNTPPVDIDNLPHPDNTLPGDLT